MDQLPLLHRADLIAIRAELGLTPGQMAERVGISRTHYLALEAGNGPISTVFQNAVRWVEHVKGAWPSNVCGACDGRGTIRPDTPGQRQGCVKARIRCEACDGVGVTRIQAEDHALADATPLTGEPDETRL